MANCDRVYERIFIGDVVTSRDVQFLKEHSIRAVLSLVDLGVALPSEVAHSYVQLSDSGKNDPEDLAEAVQTLYKMYRTSRDGNVLVHCVAGMSRSPIVVATLMALLTGRQISQCLIDIGAHRAIQPNDELLRLVLNHKEEIFKAVVQSFHSLGGLGL